ncbi:MAG: hypothetical protein WAX66_03910 [Patescibacteria group bacterium]
MPDNTKTPNYKEKTFTSSEVGQHTPSPSSASYTEIYTRHIEKLVKDKVNEAVEDRQIKYTEVLGVFATLFTFVSINIQIFSRITSLNNALIFVILEFLCLAGFVILLDIILSKKAFLGYIIIIVAALLTTIFIFLLPETPLSLEEDHKSNEMEERIDVIEKRFNDHIIRNK